MILQILFVVMKKPIVFEQEMKFMEHESIMLIVDRKFRNIQSNCFPLIRWDQAIH